MEVNSLCFQDEIQQHSFYHLWSFLYDQLHNESDSNLSDISGHHLPEFHGKLSVYPSAATTFFAPSDICCVNGMYCEHIHTVPSWR